MKFEGKLKLKRDGGVRICNVESDPGVMLTNSSCLLQMSCARSKQVVLVALERSIV